MNTQFGSNSIRADAERIWRAGVEAATPHQLFRRKVKLSDGILRIHDVEIDLKSVDRIAVIGAGKAAGAMAVEFENLLGPELLERKHVFGWVNVPADCVVATSRITLHAGRPAGVNEPRPEGVHGTRRVLQIARSLRPSDLCVCLIAGGGSALLPAPVPGITLDDKIRVTALLSGAGANIEQLNIVRRNLSSVKGGGLARACRAGQLVSLIISDVFGDPVELIASGPTASQLSDPKAALEVLRSIGIAEEPCLQRITKYLIRTGCNLDAQATNSFAREVSHRGRTSATVSNIVLGNNQTAIAAAMDEARLIGYTPTFFESSSAEGAAEDVGRRLAEMALNNLVHSPEVNCIISGGEPTVRLVDPTQRGKGGRNQQLALAALLHLGHCGRITLLSGGTDGEDGPTNAAGAFACEEVVHSARCQGLDPEAYLRRNDAYEFFRQAGGLLMTGATHTNVCDLRIVLSRREDEAKCDPL